MRGRDFRRTCGLKYGLPVSTNFSYVPDAIESWLVTDNSDPANPKKVGGYKAIASVSGVEVSGNYAYVSEGEGRLAVINVSSPANPQRVGEYRGTNDIAKVVVAGTYVYALARGEPVELANGEMGNVGSGLQVIDVSAPASPQKIGWYEYDFKYHADIAVRGKYACVTHCLGDNLMDGTGLQVIDISDPANMRRTGGCDIVSLPAVPADTVVAISGNYAYVAYNALGGCGPVCAPSGLAVIDISNPANPRRAGGSEFNYWIGVGSSDVVVSGDQVYAAVGAVVCPFVITELPAITRSERTVNGLFVQWNEPAKGMKLQRATDLTNPVWEDLLGSEKTNAVTFPIWSGNEFFRLMKP